MNMFPSCNGNPIYFTSARDGLMNLSSYALGSKQTKKLPNYKKFKIKWPSLGPDAIVYENGGLLYEYNLTSGKTRNLPIVVRVLPLVRLRSEEHTSELQSRLHLVCRLLLEKKK